MRKTNRRHAVLCSVVMVLIATTFAQVCQSEPQHVPSSAQSLTRKSEESSGRHLVPDRWWEKALALKRVTLKPNTYFTQISLEPEKLARHLDEILAQGFSGVELFAPAEGWPCAARLLNAMAGPSPRTARPAKGLRLS